MNRFTEIKDIINLKIPHNISISPKKSKISVLVQSANWSKNQYDNICYIYRYDNVNKKKVVGTKLLCKYNGVRDVQWFDDNLVIALKPGKGGHNNQIWIFSEMYRNGIQLTCFENGIESFYLLGNGILFTATRWGCCSNNEQGEDGCGYIHYGKTEYINCVYYTEIKYIQSIKKKNFTLKALPVVEITKKFPKDLVIDNIVPCKNGLEFFMNCYTNKCSDTPKYWKIYKAVIKITESRKRYISITRNQLLCNLALNSKMVKEKKIYCRTKFDHITASRNCTIKEVSPTGEQLVVNNPGNEIYSFSQSDLWIVSLKDLISIESEEEALKYMNCLGKELDLHILKVHWMEGGIYFSYVDESSTKIGIIMNEQKYITTGICDLAPDTDFQVDDDMRIAYISSGMDSMPEARINEIDSDGKVKSTNIVYCFKDINDNYGTSDSIHWYSKDGVKIEGVLRKPKKFNSKKKYPLLIVLHGGPITYSSLSLMDYEDRRYYPTIQFLQRDMLVLKPNYRGSIGRGRDFLKLNKNNLGIGDLWDIESAIEYLDQLGWVDTRNIGCMGWSQGGFISAFAGIKSNIFKAVSVGAGISSWYTYYISSDIPYFASYYLSGSPFKDISLYEKLSPISGIKNAKTPMLIQHGVDDERVPVIHAKELFRGLRANGVPVELFIYKDLGHRINTPRENYAIMKQNYLWFCHYLLGDEINLDEID